MKEERRRGGEGGDRMREENRGKRKKGQEVRLKENEGRGREERRGGEREEERQKDKA